MDNEIYSRMLAGYDLTDTTKCRNAVFEVNQQIILAGLYHGGFFDKAAFYGGTCLRNGRNTRKISCRRGQVNGKTFLRVENFMLFCDCERNYT